MIIERRSMGSIDGKQTSRNKESNEETEPGRVHRSIWQINVGFCDVGAEEPDSKTPRTESARGTSVDVLL